MAAAHRRGRLLSLVLALAVLVPCGFASAASSRLDAWYDALSISDDSIMVGQSVTLDATVSGEDTDGLLYNYGWRRDGSWEQGSWSSSLQSGAGLQTSPEWTFTPPGWGSYEVFVDVVRPDGIAVGTRVVSLTVDRGWSVPSQLGLSVSSPQYTGTTITLSAPASGVRADRVEYRWRWTRDGGEQSYASPYASASSFDFTPTHSGDYVLSVDVRDKDTGQVVTLERNFRVNRRWDLVGLDLSYGGTLRPGAQVTWNARVTGDAEGLKYNFVWERDNWAEWNSNLRSGSWATTPTATYAVGGSGLYSFSVEVEDGFGERESVSVTGVRGYSVEDARSRVINVALGEISPSQDGRKYEDALTAAGGTLCNNSRGLWCANFLWWCFDQTGQQEIFGTTGMTVDPEYLANEFASVGAYNGSSGLPGVQVGDILFSMYGSWRPGLYIGHAALVTGVSDSAVTVVEGNYLSGHGVRTLTLSRWDSHLRGYGRPAY